MAKLLHGVVHAPLGAPPPDKQKRGATMIMDKGLGIRAVYDLLDQAAPYVDYWKLPFGTALLYPESRLQEKVRAIRQAGVVVYPGGTALEIALAQGRVEAFLRWVERMGMDGVEVSDGTLEVPPDVRLRTIARAREMGLHVLTEVGKKQEGSRFDPHRFWQQVAQDRQAGAEQVIVEGRESGRGVGIYDESGAIDPEELERLAEGGPDPATLLWEAPEKEQQVAILQRFGPWAGIGNVRPEDVLALECLRRGLRSDTFRWALEEAALDDPQAVQAGY